jgi:hypothetical protein
MDICLSINSANGHIFMNNGYGHVFKIKNHGDISCTEKVDCGGDLTVLKK